MELQRSFPGALAAESSTQGVGGCSAEGVVGEQSHAFVFTKNLGLGREKPEGT